MKQNALVYTWYNITQPSMHVPSETFISHDNWWKFPHIIIGHKIFIDSWSCLGRKVTSQTTQITSFSMYHAKMCTLLSSISRKGKQKKYLGWEFKVLFLEIICHFSKWLQCVLSFSLLKAKGLLWLLALLETRKI